MKRSQRRPPRANLVRKLLASGIGYSLLYVVENDVVAAGRYDGYSRMSQAVSELSARGAPTRKFLVAMLPVPTALMTAFGIGVAESAGGNRALRVTGGLLAAGGVLQVAWLPFPMSPRTDLERGAGAGNDVGHLVLTAATILTILSQMAAGAAASGKRFRRYSLASAGTVVVAGALTGSQSAKLARGEPTPWLGLAERISIGAWLLWLAVLAIKLMRASPPRSEARCARRGAVRGGSG